MPDLYKNKYRITSARLQNWDYTWNAEYFITICTHEKVNYFGQIEHGKMVLSNVGVLADVFWHEIKNHTKNVELGAFVVMPNHVHGILILDNDENQNANTNVNVGHVETGHALSLQQSNPQTIGQKRFQNIGKSSISSIIGSYKSAVTKHSNRLNFELKWQVRFHDHIIRNSKSFDKITHYIKTNPLNWEDDTFYH